MAASGLMREVEETKKANESGDGTPAMTSAIRLPGNLDAGVAWPGRARWSDRDGDY